MTIPFCNSVNPVSSEFSFKDLGSSDCHPLVKTTLFLKLEGNYSSTQNTVVLIFLSKGNIYLVSNITKDAGVLARNFS